MLLQTILAALGPIILGLLVGWLSGKYGFIKREYSQAFADFVVKIALPFSLFLAATQASPSVFFNIDYLLARGRINCFLSYWFLGGKFFLNMIKRTQQCRHYRFHFLIWLIVDHQYYWQQSAHLV
ncbi:hypothetical protein I3679_003965 [Proteus mirabilis]|uniref:Transporter n=1 Tax=Proteus mirabilis TaxID=584 RepID=A0ABD5LQY7_PROMI